MKVALGQFAVSREWQHNAATCRRLMSEARAGGADLLVLPEGILARDIADPYIVLRTAQPVDGPFVTQLLDASRGSALTVMTSVHVPAEQGRVWKLRKLSCSPSRQSLQRFPFRAPPVQARLSLARG